MKNEYPTDIFNVLVSDHQRIMINFMYVMSIVCIN